MKAMSAPSASQRTEGPEMEALHEITESLHSRSERHRRALRDAIARRKLEQMREEKALHWFIADVWDEPPKTSPEGG
jgi:streptomycin 6-kinase